MTVSSMPFVNDHLEPFLTMAKPGIWQANAFNAWTKTVGVTGVSLVNYPDKPTRQDLKKMANDPSISSKTLMWAVLCWGRMRVNNARNLLTNEKPWVSAVNFVRLEKPHRKEAYRKFFDVANSVEGIGMGPAYYTKLIFFCDPSNDGYILDQWTAKSVNLLSGAKIVKIQNGNFVSQDNSPDVFDKFCTVVEHLTKIRQKKDPKITNENTEMCLFSKGGAKPDSWRSYVKYYDT